MVEAARTPQRDSAAIAGSIAVHLCALVLVLSVWHQASFPANDPDERTLLTSILRIEHHPPARVAQRRRALAASAPSRLTQAVPVIHAAVTVEHAARKLVVATEHRAGAVPAPLISHKPQPARATAPIQVAVTQPSAAPAAHSAAIAAPVASVAPSPVVAQHEEGIGNFGETYPAAIDPSARGALLAGMNGIAVRVTVDENGRATAIEFVRPPADATLREELRSRLLAAHFIPAACNGLRCAGTLEVKN